MITSHFAVEHIRNWTDVILLLQIEERNFHSKSPKGTKYIKSG